MAEPILCPLCRLPVASLIAHFGDKHPDMPALIEAFGILQRALIDICEIGESRRSGNPEESRAEYAWRQVDNCVARAQQGLEEALCAAARPVAHAREAVISAARSAAQLEDAYAPLRAWVEVLDDAERELARAMGEVIR